MQVSQIAELDTHAVIGGGKAHAFGMSDSAEFFTVLSDTLYRDKVRAVAREVICNAWDAHIMVNKTNVPVEITLTDEELVIKDFGPGISDDRIVPIYCIYGASTKVGDGNQTGGFGLGSKAPFAYSDHFSVTSCFDGFKTVYAVSRGGAETNGKPDIRAMVRVPTTETGITVSIPIRNADDRAKFSATIQQVVLQGGILANLNGVSLERYDYEPAHKNGFMLVRGAAYRSMTESHVYVLYGSVIYPVSSTDPDLSRLLDQVCQLKLSETRFILIAKPNTIGVTPSRESLSNSERTIETVKGLIQNVINKLKPHGKSVARELVRNNVDMAIKENKTLRRINVQSAASGGTIATSFSATGSVIYDPLTMVKIGVSGRGTQLYLNSNERLAIVYAHLAKHFPAHSRALRKQAAFAADQHKCYPALRIGTTVEDISSKFSARLFIRMISKLDLFDEGYVYDEWGWGRSKLTAIDAYRDDGEFLPILVVAPSQKMAMEVAAAKLHGGGNSTYSRQHVIFALVINRLSDLMHEKLEKLCAQYKITIDVHKKTKIHKSKGGSEKTGFNFYDILGLTKGSARRGITFPKSKTLNGAKYYLPVRGSIDDLNMPSVMFNSREDIVKRFGPVALTTSTRMEARAKAKGLVCIYDVIAKDIERLSDNKSLQLQTALEADKLVVRSYDGVAYIAQSLAKADNRFLKLFFDKTIDEKELEEIGPLAKQYRTLCEDLRYYEYCRSYYDVVSKAILKLSEKAYANNKPIDTRKDKRFEYLNIFSEMHARPSYVSTENKALFDEVYDLVVYLKRKHERKKKEAELAAIKAAKAEEEKLRRSTALTVIQCTPTIPKHMPKTNATNTLKEAA